MVLVCEKSDVFSCRSIYNIVNRLEEERTGKIEGGGSNAWDCTNSDCYINYPFATIYIADGRASVRYKMDDQG